MQPNVVVIVADALRADRVGTRGLTPNLDALASRSATFTEAFSTTNVTDVAVTSIQTGRYPLSHGVVNHGFRITDEEKAAVETTGQLPELLSDAGYRTGKFGRPLGRWHRNGFDHYPVTGERETAFDESDETKYSDIGTRLDAIHPTLRDLGSTAYQRVLEPTRERLFGARNDVGDDYFDDTPDEVVRDFDAFVGESGPCYAFVHLMDTHVPYAVDPNLVREYLDRYDYEVERLHGVAEHVPTHFHDLVTSGAFPEVRERYYFGDDQPSSAVVSAHYDAAVTEVDRRIGALIDVLDARDQFENTLLVVLSDHGESLTEHGIYYDHHGLYDVSTRIPFVVNPPNYSGTPATFDDLVQLTDVAPTVLDYLDLDPVPEMDGLSLRPTLDAGEPLDRSVVLAEEAHTQRRRMLRTREEKLIYLVEGDTVCRYCGVQHAPATELYDLRTDREERHNLASERPERVTDLRAQAEEMATVLAERRGETSEETVEYDDEAEIHDRLEALGYR
ncbi:sulfatase family protein [Salinirubrum litoreum]|uniref:Sulfatase n=1 Tax=Salinirubrum litoreum TaxID=1126234 RepID=A0ABD5R7J2_9EURY|nr:sulfatase [Salinirubrum litoreum]